MRRRVWRIAVASSDAKVINEHFGRANEIFIIDLVSEGTYTFVEKRATAPISINGEDSQQALSERVEALKDCIAVLVAQIGTLAERALEQNGISVFVQPDYIDSALLKLARYFAKTKFIKPEE